MNLFVRLLLDIRIDLLDLVSIFLESRRVSFRQSGIVAKTDAVASGSRIITVVRVFTVKADRIFVCALP
jgi:hypothetical protein